MCFGYRTRPPKGGVSRLGKRLVKSVVDCLNVVELCRVLGVGQTLLHSEGSTGQSIVNIAYTADEGANIVSNIQVGPGVSGNAFQQTDLGVCFQSQVAIVETDPTKGTVVTAQEYLVRTQVFVQADIEVTVPVSIGVQRSLSSSFLTAEYIWRIPCTEKPGGL